MGSANLQGVRLIAFVQGIQVIVFPSIQKFMLMIIKLNFRN